MVTLKQIQKAIEQKAKGLNCDINTLLRITKENTEKENTLIKENLKYINDLKKLGVNVL